MKESVLVVPRAPTLKVIVSMSMAISAFSAMAQSSGSPIEVPSHLSPPPVLQPKISMSKSSQLANAVATNISGSWADTYKYVWIFTNTGNNIAGSVNIVANGGCNPKYLRWDVTGSSTANTFTLTAKNPSGGAEPGCVKSFTYSMTLASATSASGPWTNTSGGSGTVTMNLTCEVKFKVNPSSAGPKSGSGQNTTMNASFTPTDLSGKPMTLAAAGAACGYVPPYFNWQQKVMELPNPVPLSVCNTVKAFCFYASGSPSTPLVAPPPFFDPPQGGYAHRPGDDPYPYYLTSSEVALLQPTPSQLNFTDQPKTHVLNPSDQKLFKFTPSAKAMVFATALVGVLPDGSPSVPLYTWTWNSTFNVKNGGVTKNLVPTTPETDSSGGAAITSINGVVLPLQLGPQEIAIKSSGLVYSRTNQAFVGSVTLKNVSNASISGPLQVVFFGLPTDVELINAIGDLSGTPYLTIPAASGLAPGASVTVPVQFKNPLNTTINVNPVGFSGSIR